MNNFHIDVGSDGKTKTYETLDVERIMKDLERAYSTHHKTADIFVGELAAILKDDPDKGLKMIISTYNRALDDAYTDEEGQKWRGYVEATCGGPFEAIPRAVYNAVGAVYPYLNEDHKEIALREVLNILDRIRYDIVQSVHANGIKDPILLSDISIVRPLYWPGLDEGKEIIKKYSNFSELNKDIINEDGLFKVERVQSDFVVGYSMLRSDMCNFGEDFIEIVDKEFLSRVIRGVVALRFAPRKHMKKGNEVAGLKRLKVLLPKQLHEKIEFWKERAYWINHEKFR